MSKLNKTFKINPLYEADGYKPSHIHMLAPNVSREYWNWIPRSLKYMHPSIEKVMSAGQQLTWRYIHSNFQELFFDQPVEVALKFGRDIAKYIMMDYDAKHFAELHQLGYLPVEIKSLPEGMFTKNNIPNMTGINTVDGYAWLGLFLETLISKLSWQMPTAATIGFQFKKNAIEWVKKTDVENLWLADYMCHDFHSRGGNPYSSIAVGLGHALSNSGSDTINIIPASRYYYDFDEEEVPVNSVNASEHSVTCTGIFYYERLLKEGKLNHEIEKYYSFDVPCEGSVENPDYLAISEYLNLRDWLSNFPKGILSVVSDTFDLWKLITYILPRLKEEIMARDGKLVIRPDSGDPADIICGTTPHCSTKTYEDNRQNQHKGVIELLADIFGYTTNNQGFKVLDSHIGAIYGDSINLERQIDIYQRLVEKGFAVTNVVLGVGSYTYIMLTRDSAGYAIKGNWFETLLEGERTQYNIFKDPITDSGTKKSLKGFQFVYEKDGEIEAECEVSEEKYNSEENLLKTIYKDGKFHNQTSLTEIRESISKLLA